MASYNDILTKVYSVLTPFAKEEQPLTEETGLVADLGLDSMQVMRLLLEIEDYFDISIPVNILPDIRTIRDLAVQLEKLVNEG
jgi:acyl carrier protein